jgi:hypothetical protein
VGSSCEAYSLVRGLWVAGGQKSEEPAHVAAYVMARLRERAFATQPLPDQGTNDTDLLGAITLTGDSDNDKTVWGLVPSKVWGDTPEHLSADLPFDVVQAAVPISPGDVALVDAFGADLIASVQAHALARQPVKFTMAVDAAYENLWGPVAYQGLAGPSLGWHAQLGVGWRPSLLGALLPDILVEGSWGDGWADGGYSWIAGAAFVAVARDLIACLGCPVL